MKYANPPEPDLWLEEALPRFAASRDTELRDEILKHVDWLAARGARRFSDSGEPFDDLLQVARLGLFKALERFDPSMGVPFGAYATPTVIGEVRRHFRDHTWSVHVPRRAKDLRLAVNNAVHELTGQLGRAPKVDEIAGHLEIDPEAVLEAMDASAAYRSHSLDPIRSARIASVDSSQEESMNREIVVGLLDRLPPRERKVVYLRFYEEMSQAQIAEQIGTSQVHVGRILSASLVRLRSLIDSGPD